MTNSDQRRRPAGHPHASIDGFLRTPRPAVQGGLTQTLRPSLRRPPLVNAPPPSKIAPSLPRVKPSKGRTKKPRIKSTRKRLILRFSLGVVALFVLAGGWLAWRGFSTVNKVFHGNVFSDAHALFSNTKLKGEDQGRVNILLAGDSADDPNHGGAQLTDSIMILSLDTKKRTGFMLSVPRDLWVNIPGWSHQKINAANDATDFNQAGYPAGGMGQLEEIVQTQLGIPINYYALVNYTAFKDSVNAVGGITVNIQSTDPRGLYDPNISAGDGGPLLLKSGVQILNGQTALNLARARGDPTYDGRVAYGFPHSDYDRTQHQRQMMLALEQKASSAGVLANPLKVSQLFSAVGNNIATDLKLGDVLRAVQLVKGVNLASMQSLALTNSGQNALLKDYLTPNGQEALIPAAGVDNFGQIQQYYQQLTSSNPIVKEAPSVAVLNASDVVGLAHKEQVTLQGKGFNVSAVADANNLHPSTMILDTTNGQKPASRQLLQQMFPGSAIATSTVGSTEAQEAQGYTVDFVVILGQNQNKSQATASH
jgi:polyisoprenyl-teichoic acid--peptidoglycan teichoic acid transferase